MVFLPITALILLTLVFPRGWTCKYQTYKINFEVNEVAFVSCFSSLLVCHMVHIYNELRWLEIVFEIFFTRKRFTFIYIITAFMVAA